MKSKLLLAISLVVLLSACNQRGGRHHQHALGHDVVHEYRRTNDDFSFVYWYILMSGNNTYYYTSPTRLYTFESIAFAKSPATGLPANVTKAVEESEEIGTETLADATKPENVEHDEEVEDTTEAAQSEAMTSEGAPATTESTTSTETAAPAESGGGDSGGGGGGDGGGGGSD